jgi:hypothetical protein
MMSPMIATRPLSDSGWLPSAATELGYSDVIIGAQLGRAKNGITGRYATAPDPAMVAVVDRKSIALVKALDDTEADKIVKLASSEG